MSDGEVIYAAERFQARKNRPDEQKREVGGIVIYLSAPRDQDKLVATNVFLATSSITSMLDAKGHQREATLIIERAHQFICEGIPVDEVREMIGMYLQDIDPALFAAYEASNH